MQTILLGFQYVFSDPMCIALLALGVFVGIIFGSIPGLTATLGVTLFIPFTYTMQPVQGLVMLIAVYVGGISRRSYHRNPHQHPRYSFVHLHLL